jgi:hypothetical protein
VPVVDALRGIKRITLGVKAGRGEWRRRGNEEI